METTETKIDNYFSQLELFIEKLPISEKGKNFIWLNCYVEFYDTLQPTEKGIVTTYGIQTEWQLKRFIDQFKTNIQKTRLKNIESYIKNLDELPLLEAKNKINNELNKIKRKELLSQIGGEKPNNWQNWLKSFLENEIDYKNKIQECNPTILTDIQIIPIEKPIEQPFKPETFVDWLVRYPQLAEKEYPEIYSGLTKRIEERPSFECALIIDKIPDSIPGMIEKALKLLPIQKIKKLTEIRGLIYECVNTGETSTELAIIEAYKRNKESLKEVETYVSKLITETEKPSIEQPFKPDIDGLKTFVLPDNLQWFAEIETELFNRGYIDGAYKWMKNKTDLIDFLTVIYTMKVFRPSVNGKRLQDFHKRQFISGRYGQGKTGLTETAKKHKPKTDIAVIPFSWIKKPK